MSLKEKKQEYRQKIIDLIKVEGKYLTSSMIREKLGITRSQLGYLELNLTALNKECGFVRRAPNIVKTPTLSKEEAIIKITNFIQKEGKYITGYELRGKRLPAHLLSTFGINLHELNIKLGYFRSSPFEKISKQAIRQQIIKYIKKEKRYISQQELVVVLGVSLGYITKSGIDTVELNKQYGQKYKMNYFENLAEKAFTELNIEFKSQKWFPDLISDSDRITHLRFDFYIPTLNLAVECNGSQHWDKTHRFYSDRLIQNDKLKEEYCCKKGISLLKIPFAGRWKTTSEYIKSCFLEHLRNLSATTQPEKAIVNRSKKKGIEAISSQSPKAKLTEMESVQRLVERRKAQVSLKCPTS